VILLSSLIRDPLHAIHLSIRATRQLLPSQTQLVSAGFLNLMCDKPQTPFLSCKTPTLFVRWPGFDVPQRQRVLFFPSPPPPDSIMYGSVFPPMCKVLLNRAIFSWGPHLFSVSPLLVFSALFFPICLHGAVAPSCSEFGAEVLAQVPFLPYLKSTFSP